MSINKDRYPAGHFRFNGSAVVFIAIAVIGIGSGVSSSFAHSLQVVQAWGVGAAVLCFIGWIAANAMRDRRAAKARRAPVE